MPTIISSSIVHISENMWKLHVFWILYIPNPLSVINNSLYIDELISDFEYAFL